MRRFIHPFDIAYGIMLLGVVWAFWAVYDEMTAIRVAVVALLAYFAGGAKYQ